MNFAKILVPLDGSILGEAALEPAVKVLDGGIICLLRAAEAQTLPAADSPETQVAALREAQQYLKKIRKSLADRGLNVEARVWYGPPAAAIVTVACSEKVDLIVMATHGRSGLERLVLGSVTESVLRSAPVPILVVRPEGVPAGVVAGATPAGADFRV